MTKEFTDEMLAKIDGLSGLHLMAFKMYENLSQLESIRLGLENGAYRVSLSSAEITIVLNYVKQKIKDLNANSIKI